MIKLRTSVSRCALLLALPIAACAPQPVPVLPMGHGMPTFTGNPPEPVAESPAKPPAEVRATIVAGTPPPPTVRIPVAVNPANGDISLNFPGANVHVVAQAVLGDILHLPFQVAPGLANQVTLVTSQPVARASVFTLLEDALKASNLAITQSGGVFSIMPVEAARGVAVAASPGAGGFGTETIRLQFVNAAEMKRLLDPILPGVVTGFDPAQNVLMISGTSGQRNSVRELLGQFDVNWLRNMSFALIVPSRTDARLIVPELEKLINGDGAPTKGLVRLITMERLNGILAISAQRQYLDDVRRWIEILDREGQNTERRMFVYRVQNGRSKDLAHVLNVAFGNASGSGSSAANGGDGFALDGSARSRDTNDARNQRDVQVAGTPQAGGPGGNAMNGGANAPGGTGAAAASLGGSTIHAVISSDETNNAIVVFGTPHDYAIIEDALRKLDLLPQQVLIEAAITEVTLNDKLRYGVQWNFQAGDTNFAMTDNTTSVPSRVFPGFSFFFSGSSIVASLNALEEQTNVNVLSAPKLLVLNNQTAALQVGDQVPIATQSAVGVVNPDAPIVNSIEYRDTGVILKITPRVNAGGLVLLDISQEVSDVSPTSTSSLNSPTISTRRISTSIAVQDGQVIALGGLIRDVKTAGTAGLPLLSRLPIIGGLLFGQTNNKDVRTELLVLIRPRVLRSIDDARAITDELRLKIKGIEPVIKGTTVP
jgi:general secretion pathway protein D